MLSNVSPTVGDMTSVERLVAMVMMTYLMTTGDAVQFLGFSADWRENEDSVKRAIFIVDPTSRVPEDGHVVAWNVYTTRGRRSQKVHLQMWRPVKPADNRYQFVGETVVVAMWVGPNLFTLYPTDRIAVRRGDVIGIYFPKYNPVPWSAAASCPPGSEHLFKYNPYGPTMGSSTVQEITFDRARTDWNPCRQYSLNATIMTEQELSHFDYDYQETTDGRYERRPYWPYIQASDTTDMLWTWPPRHNACLPALTDNVTAALDQQEPTGKHLPYIQARQNDTLTQCTEQVFMMNRIQARRSSLGGIYSSQQAAVLNTTTHNCLTILFAIVLLLLQHQ